MNKRKGISLIVLVITILVMLILSGVVIVSLSKNNPIEKAKEATFKQDSKSYVESLSLNVASKVSENGPDIKGEINASLYNDMKKYIGEFKKEHTNLFNIIEGELVYTGVNEKQKTWAKEAGIKTDVATLPIPTTENSFQKIKWENGEEVILSDNDITWYNYNQKKLPNIKLEDGSYYVWIPRYAYRLIYYSNESDLKEAEKLPKGDIKREEKAIGFSDIRGIVNKQGIEDTSFSRRYVLFDYEYLGEKENKFSYIENDKYKYDVTKTKGEENPRGLVVHPAFSNFRRNNLVFTEGNFGEVKDLNGFWVSKFELTIDGKSHPNRESGVSISSNTIYEKTKSIINTDKFESMNMSITKWGAIIYLTQGWNIDIAKNTLYRTGGVDYLKNTDQSNTGNVTGIYDLNGCRWEYLNAYVANGNSNLTLNAKALVDNKNTRNVDVYSIGNVDDGNKNFIANSKRYGDGIFEVSTLRTDYILNNKGYGGKMACGDTPIFANGAAEYNENSQSFITVHRDAGQPYGGTSFRGVILEK